MLSWRAGISTGWKLAPLRLAGQAARMLVNQRQRAGRRTSAAPLNAIDHTDAMQLR
jgi:hypothetical protein